MGAVADLNKEGINIDDGKDSIVIRQCIACIIGGRTLDMTGFDGTFIRAGHVVIRDTQTDTYKPMPVSGDKYSSLPGNHEYVGVVVCSKPASRPFVSIMYNGEVNDKAVPYPVETIKEAMKTALPNLVFMHD